MSDLIEYRLHDGAWLCTLEGAQATYVFDPERPEATDRGRWGMVEEMRVFAERTRKCKRLLDVGALFGVFSLVFASRPGASAVAIEASPWAFPILQEHCNLNPAHHIQTLQLFAGEKTGRGVHCTRDWKHVVANLDRPSAEKIDLVETALDDMPTLGDFDCMKIDVESYECQVLRGAAKLIRRCRPLIFLEMHCDTLCDNGESREALEQVIADLGYRLEHYDGTPVGPLDNYIFARALALPN